MWFYITLGPLLSSPAYLSIFFLSHGSFAYLVLETLASFLFIEEKKFFSHLRTCLCLVHCDWNAFFSLFKWLTPSFSLDVTYVWLSDKYFLIIPFKTSFPIYFKFYSKLPLLMIVFCISFLWLL